MFDKCTIIREKGEIYISLDTIQEVLYSMLYGNPSDVDDSQSISAILSTELKPRLEKFTHAAGADPEYAQLLYQDTYAIIEAVVDLYSSYFSRIGDGANEHFEGKEQNI